jgi:phage terminase large subunit-like protein
MTHYAPKIDISAKATVYDLLDWPKRARKHLLDNLTDLEASVLQYNWKFWARSEQIPPLKSQTGTDWLYWLYLAGRGAGKTKSGAEWIRSLAEGSHCEYMALVGANAADVNNYMIYGSSGIMACSPPWFRPEYKKQAKMLIWPNGVKALCYSAIDPESLRGPNIGAAWLDELAKWRYGQEAWDMLAMTMREGSNPLRMITTTPRPSPLLKRILSLKNTALSRGTTYDNIINLAPSFIDDILEQYEGTRLGRQELRAEVLEDNPDALWQQTLIDELRIKEAPLQLSKTVIGVDPPVSSNKNSDECGIIAVAADDNKPQHAYVLADHSCQGYKPKQWAERVITAYHLHEADAIIVEVNQGGDLVSEVIRQIDQNVRILQVRAYKGKWLRAEPVSGLYEQKRVHHVGTLAALEDQMCSFEPALIQKNSPDRVDALVYAVMHVMERSNPRLRTL